MKLLAQKIQVYFDKIFDVTSNSPAEIILSGANYDSSVTNPNFFKDHIAPALTAQAKTLHKKGILVVPDFVANAGGVISSYVEFIEGFEDEVFDLIKEKITKNTKLVLEKADKEKITPREAALLIAKERIKKFNA